MSIRRLAGEQPHGFAQLRREGIEHLQALCGESWTDYNLHDPGVTILEQLCYALTDLHQRAGLDVADLLAGVDGTIDLPAQALYPPQEIFPCRATTVADYRKLILDRVSELDNVWLRARPGGLYEITARLPDDTPDPERARAQVRAEYLAQRNLCEDALPVTMTEQVGYQLRGACETEGTRFPADILADVYYACARYVQGAVRRYPLAEEAAAGRTPEEIFSGPGVRHGVVRDGELGRDPAEIPVSELFTVVRGVPGIRRIVTLQAVRDGVAVETLPCDLPLSAPGIRVPWDETPGAPPAAGVRLIRRGREIEVPPDLLRARYEELRFRDRTNRRTLQDVDSVFAPPRGRYRDPGRYASVQGQFPRAYGINEEGVPPSAGPAAMARARQLKAYLLLFEQLMANFCAQTQGLKTLYRAHPPRTHSYACQSLQEAGIADLAAIYPSDAPALLEQVTASIDDPLERHNRVLDYLLALYGEQFTQTSLQHYDFYRDARVSRAAVLENKTRFLDRVVTLGRDRAGGFDYTAGYWDTDNVSGLHRRVALLLGFDSLGARRLCAALPAVGLTLLEHGGEGGFRARYQGTEALDRVEGGRESGDWETFAGVDLAGADEGEERERLASIPALRRDLSAALLRDGVFLRNYRLVAEAHGEGFGLLFKCSQERDWWRLGRYPDREAGVRTLAALWRLLLRLSRQSEGLHVVEHVLLRPGGGDLDSDEQAFHAQRLSCVLPAWTARCHHREFRHLARETIDLNCPAHLLADLYWLGFEEMQAFESCLHEWLERLRDADAPAGERDRAAADLRTLLHTLGERHAAFAPAVSDGP